MKWIVKSYRGQFDNQPQDLRAQYAIENRFFVCDCADKPNGDFVIEFPEQFHGISTQFIYLFQNGKRAFVHLTEEYGISLSEDADHKGRRAIQYTPQQIQFRLDLIKWIALNVFLPDKKRMLNIDQAEVERVTNEINSFSDDRLLKDYVRDNLYYNC